MKLQSLVVYSKTTGEFYLLMQSGSATILDHTQYLKYKLGELPRKFTTSWVEYRTDKRNLIDVYKQWGEPRFGTLEDGTMLNKRDLFSHLQQIMK